MGLTQTTGGLSHVTRSLITSFSCTLAWVLCTVLFAQTNTTERGLLFCIQTKCRALDEREKKVISHSYWRYQLLQEVMTSGCCVMLRRNTSHTQLPYITHTEHTILTDRSLLFKY